MIAIGSCVSGVVRLLMVAVIAVTAGFSSVSAHADDRAVPVSQAPAQHTPDGGPILSPDQQQQMMSMTAQQTLLVMAAVGGAALVAATGGLQPALLVGSAVLGIYMFMP